MILKEYDRDIYGLKPLHEVVDICKNIDKEHVMKVASMIEKKFSVILKEGN